jgi:heme-degrading monooxygenase HmoA
MPTLTDGRIRHGVVFTLKHAEGSPEEADFLRANAALASIPGVEAFELMREVSPKNGFEHALTMEFADRAAYEAYNEHPQHAGFVANRWDNEVADFLEIDTVAR